MHYKIFRGRAAERSATLSEPCEGKNQYTLRVARELVNKLHKKGRFKRARIYQCGDHWHIARQRENRTD